MPDHESDMWRRTFVRLVKRGANPAQGNILGMALSDRDARRSYRNGHGKGENQKLALFHGRIISDHNYEVCIKLGGVPQARVAYVVAGLSGRG